MSEFELVLRNPFTMTIAGPTKCGKTTLVNKIIRNSFWLYSEKPNCFFYFYNSVKPSREHKDIHSNVVQFINGLPDLEWLKDTVKQYGKNITIIVDDQDMNLTGDMATLFTVGSHHLCTNMIFITHNLFNRSKENIYRDMSLNTDYFVLCKQVRDKTQVRRFFSQYSPDKSKVGLQIYNDATALPYSYLWMDLHQETPDNMRMLSNMFWENQTPPLSYTF